MSGLVINVHDDFAPIFLFTSKPTNLNKNKNNRQKFHAHTKNVTLSNLYLILLQVLLSFCQ